MLRLLVRLPMVIQGRAVRPDDILSVQLDRPASVVIALEVTRDDHELRAHILAGSLTPVHMERCTAMALLTHASSSAARPLPTRRPSRPVLRLLPPTAPPS